MSEERERDAGRDSGAPARAPFDMLGPLPTGTALLEASAGTGKTYTIAALVARYVAEGQAELKDLLVVTFGRAATRELRERVRERLAASRDALADPAGAKGSADPLTRSLARGSAADVAARRDRLAAATADFDAATIVTTHAFCQLVIRGLGTAAGVDPDTELVEDLLDLVNEVALDFYLRKYHRSAAAPDFPLDLALRIAREAALDVHADLAPAPGVGTGAADVRARYAVAVRAEVARRLAARRAMGFDSLLTRLRDALVHREVGPPVRARLRERYRVVLVDEFQDTDPVQWEILQAAFHGHVALVLIGDPKQAIYAFRGGDVHSYLAAAETAAGQATLPTNFRSDAGVLRGLDALLGGAQLGDPRIAVGPVAPGRPEPLLRRPAPFAPVRVRVLPTAALPAGTNGLPYVDPVRAAVTEDLLADIVDVLDDGSTLRADADGAQRAVEPGDIAVLVATNREGEAVRDRLVGAGVPTVLRATTSVFGTVAAAEWVALLEAIESPHRVGRVRRLAVSPFVGQDAAAVAAGGDEAHDQLAQRVRSWGATLTERGVAALFAAVDAERGTLARLLGEVGGERLATDLRHLADILHAAAVTERLGPAALLIWLRRRIAEVDRDPSAERSRRLDSDSAAVQVVTIHMSKGLEFPLVYLPFAWTRWVRPPEVALFHDPGTGRRTRHVGGPGSIGWDAALTAHQAELAGEDLRLLYVAATRARSQLTMWWARSGNTPTAALHRVLFAATAGVPPASAPAPDDADALAALRARADAAAGAFAVEPVPARGPAAWTAPPPPAGAPRAASFDRAVDTAWRRTSYSALTALAHAAGPAVGSEPEEPGTADEPADASAGGVEMPPRADDAAGDAAAAPASPFAGLPGGAAFGTLVHDVLEGLDLVALDRRREGLSTALRSAIDPAIARAPVAGVEPAALLAALEAAMTTALGPLAGGRTLLDFSPGDWLRELDFELPLAGGDAAGPAIGGGPVLGDLAPLLAAHLPAGDPVRPYAERLAGADLAGQPLRGYLTGSIDVVLRVPGGPGGGGPASYLVVDYKTNRLHPYGEDGSGWLEHYRPAALGLAMRAADYPLQALLYQVALHRYLTWRQPDYDAASQLGGVLYLFLRGMCGPGSSEESDVPGVFAWRPPASLIVALSDALAGGPP